ncbi:MAG: putative peptidoglycan glycosyltransferase FtsW [Chitinivibrionales bacterium]|nr:putative peptidoglycan glycosyltransferase FtsW [Chitinivibrionales bacterium]
MSRNLSRIDIGVFVITLLMVGFGVVLVYSSSFAVASQKFGGADFFLARHCIRVVLALACFIVFINVDYHVWGKLSHGAFIVAIVLLLIVLVLPGHTSINGAKRWIPLGFMRFQASEFALMALIFLMAQKIDEHGEEIREWKKLSGHLVRIGLVCALIVVEPNFSTASIVGITGLVLLFIAGARFRQLGGVVLSLAPLAAAAMLAAPYRRHRLMGFLHFGQSKETIGYQAYQSIVGLGNGGLFGVGLGKGEEKFFFLPEPHTDFIFSIIGEEIGFLGLLMIFALFSLLIYRGARIAFRAPDKLGQILAFGFTFEIALYVLVHAAVNVGLVPTTGIPMPFLSYGGMSLLFTVSSMGILLNISSQCGARLPALHNKFSAGRVAPVKTGI